MKIIVLNGVNLNLLGLREPELYGKNTYKDLVRFIKEKAKSIGVKVKVCQSNSETEIVEKIQLAYGRYDGLIINPAAFTHTSVAILDAIKAVDIPTVEVHLTDVDSREDFRKISYVSLVAFKKISGKGFDGYFEALEAVKEKIEEKSRQNH